MTAIYDAIVIGSGVAGLSATNEMLSRRRTLSVATIEAELFGGLVINVNELDGAVGGSGVDLASNLMTDASDRGASTLSELVTSVSACDVGWVVETNAATHRARVVIVASGARLKKLGVPGEDTFEYRGVSHCADCDGPLFADQDVVVAGGGDSALQGAHVLSAFCRHVHIVNQSSHFTARPAWVEAVGRCSNISVFHAAHVVAIAGVDSVESVIVRSLSDDSTREITCKGFFGFIGLVPSTSFLPAEIPRDAGGFLLTDQTQKAANAMFAAGAVRSGYGGMLEHAIAEGVAAAGQALRVLS